MTEISKMLNTYESTKTPHAMNGIRVLNRVSFNPTSANPGETLRINLPLLDEGVVLEPNSFKLVFELQVDAGKDTNHTVFNVSRNLVDSFKVNFGKHTISHIHRYDLYMGYHDLLQINEDMMMGITTSTKRKIRANTSDKSTNAKYVLHCAEYGMNYSIPLSHPILDDHGCFYNIALKDKLEFNLVLAKKEDVIITSDLSKAHSYKLNNIELEYTTIRNADLVNEVSGKYMNGRTFFLEDIHLFKEFPINFSTEKTFRVTIDRSVEHMKGLLFLFTKTYTAGARNTEEFINPAISSVKVTIDGTPNSLYSESMRSTDVYKDILKKVGKVHKNFDEDDFRYHKFGLWVDLRMSQDNTLHGDGREFKNGSGLVINITSKSVEPSVICHVFIVSDSAVFVKNGRVEEYKV